VNLAEQHRLTQAQVGALTVVRMRAVWPLLDPEDIDGTYSRWLMAAAPVIETQRTVSSRVAAAFLSASKRMALPGAQFVPVIAGSVDPAALATSLMVTGPVSIRSAMKRGVPIARASSIAEASSSSAAMRHALNGGRQTFNDSLDSDPDARGWRRISSGSACAFCKRLSGKRHPTANADFPAHDGCGCSQEPIWD